MLSLSLRRFFVELHYVNVLGTLSLFHLAINEWVWVGYEELSRSRRVLSTLAFGLDRWMTASEKKLKCLELIKKASLWLALSSSLVIFLGDYRAFFREKWRIKVEHSDWGNKSIMYKGLIISHVKLQNCHGNVQYVRSAKMASRF